MKELVAEPTTPPGDAAPVMAQLRKVHRPEAPVVQNHSAPGWHRKFVDSYDLARQAMSAGQAQKAIDLMRCEVERQLSGRGQFFRKLQLVEICIAAGQAQIAQPILDDLVTIFDNNHVDQWEEKAVVAKALVTIIKSSQRVQGDESEKYQTFPDRSSPRSCPGYFLS